MHRYSQRGRQTDRQTVHRPRDRQTYIQVVDELIAPPKPGSRRVEFYGNKFSVNKALGAMQYRTDLNYNRLSRNKLCYPPPLEKTAACRSLPVPFDPTTNDVDTMLVIADDMGNSGGTERQPQISRRSIEILPEAVNDRPRIHAPMQAIAVEDWAFSFVNPDKVGFAGLALPEPVYYKEFVDQQCFFMQRDDGTRPPVDVNGLDQECGCTRQCAVPVHNQFSMTSCACNNDDCTLTCDTLQGTRLKALLGDRIKSIRGRQGPAIYLSDPDYLDFGFEFLPVEVNMRYGLEEALLIEVSDEGALGNQAPTPDNSPLRSLWEIELEVESVNDPPVISRLEAAQDEAPAGARLGQSTLLPRMSVHTASLGLSVWNEEILMQTSYLATHSAAQQAAGDGQKQFEEETMEAMEKMLD